MAGEADDPNHAHRLTLEQASWLTVLRARRRHFDELRETIFRLSQFLAFAVGAEIQFTEMRGEATITIQNFGNGFKHDEKVEG